MAPKVTPEYVPYSTVKPMGPRDPTEHVRIETPQVGFHNAVGQALGQLGEGYGTLSRATREVAASFDNLGSAFAHTGTELWNRAQGLQQVQNQTIQTKAEIEFDKYVSEKQVAFSQLQGDAANETTYKAHLTDIEDKRKAMMDKLPNQAVQHGFDRSTASTIGRIGMQAAQHAATETRKAFIGSSEARVDQYKDQISKTTDIKETEDLAKRVHDEIYGKQAPARGWTLDQANKAYRDTLSDAYASQITTISRTDPTTARKMLEENKALISQPKYDSTMEHVLQNERIIQSRNIGNEIQDADPDATLEEKREKAKQRAKEINPNSPLLPDDAARVVTERHETHRREVHQQLQKDKELVEQDLYGFGNKEGKVPVKREDLFVNEDTRKAWERLTPRDKDRVDKILLRHAKGDIPETPMTRLRVNELEGMWLNDPGQFRDHDLLSEEIPLADRSRLRKLQLQSIKEGIKLEADPRTASAIATMKRSGGVIPKDLTPAHTARWNTFTGLVREALIAKGKERGFDKPLTDEEIVNIGKTLLEKLPGSGWFSDYRVFETLEVTEKDLQVMRQRWPNETDDELTRRYRQTVIRDEYNKRYGPQGTKLPERGPTVRARPPSGRVGPGKPAEEPPAEGKPPISGRR